MRTGILFSSLLLLLALKTVFVWFLEGTCTYLLNECILFHYIAAYIAAARGGKLGKFSNTKVM